MKPAPVVTLMPTDRPDLFVGGPKHVDNDSELVDLGAPRQEGAVGQQFSQDATARPAGRASKDGGL